MTSPVASATLDLLEALKTVPNTTATADPGSQTQLPALVIGPPRLVWKTTSSEPTEATYIVFAVVDANQYAIERLWDLTTAVAEAIDLHMRNATVTAADPGVFVSGTAQLPCYNITIEVGI